MRAGCCAVAAILLIAAAAPGAARGGPQSDDDAFGGGLRPPRQPPPPPPRQPPPPPVSSPSPRPRDDDENSDNPFTGEAVAVEFVRRPLIEPYRTWQVFFDLPVRRTQPYDPSLGFSAGARSGFSENFELGVILWPVIFHDGINASAPSLFGLYRLVRRRAVEFGLFGGLGVAYGAPDWAGELAAPLLLRLGSALRLDITPRYRHSTNDAADPETLAVAAAGTLQIVRELRLTLTAGGALLHHRERTAQAQGDLFYTFPGALGAAADVGASFLFPQILDSATHPRVYTHHWVATASVRLYFKMEPNPLDSD